MIPSFTKRALGVLLICAASGVSCTETPSAPALPPSEHTLNVQPSPVPLVRPNERAEGEKRLQLLIDESASMIGANSLIPLATGLVAKAVSLAHGVDFSITESRVCAFAAGRDFRCVDGLRPLTFSPLGYTNLHDAVSKFRERDLSVLLTDGVPAQLGPGIGACAGGVDAGCVAQALRETLHPVPGADQSSTPGLWLLPVVIMHSGRFLTERHQDAGSYRAESATAAVRQETATNATIASPIVARDGTLIIDYTGPRSLYLMVHASDRRAGQALVARIYEQAQAEPIQLLTDLSEYQKGTALLPPIELYPAVPDARPPASCNLRGDSELDSFDPCTQIRWQTTVQCAVTRTNKATLELDVLAADGPLVQYVVPLRVTAASPQGAKPISGTPWNAPMMLTVACSEVDLERCEAPHSIEWRAAPSFSSFGSEPMAPYLRALSTADLSEHPHRLLSLEQLLRNLYQRLDGQEVPAAPAALTICKA